MLTSTGPPAEAKSLQRFGLRVLFRHAARGALIGMPLVFGASVLAVVAGMPALVAWRGLGLFLALAFIALALPALDGALAKLSPLLTQSRQPDPWVQAWEELMRRPVC